MANALGVEATAHPQQRKHHLRSMLNRCGTCARHCVDQTAAVQSAAAGAVERQETLACCVSCHLSAQYQQRLLCVRYTAAAAQLFFPAELPCCLATAAYLQTRQSNNTARSDLLRETTHRYNKLNRYIAGIYTASLNVLCMLHWIAGKECRITWQ